MCCGLLVGVVVGVRRRERKRRHGREAWEKGLKVVRKVVIVLIGMVMAVVEMGFPGEGSCKSICGCRGFYVRS